MVAREETQRGTPLAYLYHALMFLCSSYDPCLLIFLGLALSITQELVGNALNEHTRILPIRAPIIICYDVVSKRQRGEGGPWHY